MQRGKEGTGAQRVVRASEGAPRRILFLESSVGGGVIGGSLTGILELLPHLDRSRWEPALVLAEPKPALDPADVPLHVLTPRRGSGGVDRGALPVRVLRRASEVVGIVAPRARELMPLIRRERPALVYLASGLTSNLAGVLAAARCGVPVICHFKGFRRVGPVDRFCSRWIDTAIGMTDEICEHYRSRRIRARRFVTIYDGVDVGRFASVDEGRLASWTQTLKAQPGPIVLAVGGVEGRKNTLATLRAFRRVRHVHPTAQLWILGGATVLDHGEYRAEFDRELATLSAQERAAVTEIGVVDDADVPAIFRLASVLAFPSLHEGFGLAALEALAASLPVVASYHPPLTEFLDESCALLVDPTSDADIARGILEALRGPRDARNAAGLRRARAHSWSHVATLHIEHYRRFAKRTKAARETTAEENRHA